MRICPKCSKQVTDESRICRDCGAILDELREDQEAGGAPQAKTIPESSFPSAAEPPADRQQTGEQPRRAEVVPSLHEPFETGDSEAPAWKCPQCGETVPGTFDQCWKCLTTKEGEKPDQRELEFLAEALDASEAGYDAEATDPYADAVVGDEDDEDDDEDSPSHSACPRCGSTQIIRDLTVRDFGDGSSGTLQVVVFGDPGALVFKDRLYGELRADICGDCGHVELRVANPGKLYRHYRKSLE